ncbi:MAG: hypothetical protein ACI9VR_005352 [Cognaticolwellia sp.]|jgi:hypothetical protein
MSRRALSTLELVAALPCLLFVLVVGVDLAGLTLERALLKGQLAQACMQARSANQATPPAYSAPDLDLEDAFPDAATNVEVWPQDPWLVCQAQRPVQGLIGVVVRPHTLRVRHRLPAAP